MIVTVSEIVNAVDGLKELSDSEFKASTSLKIARIAKTLDIEYDLFNDARTKLFTKYGTPDDESGNVVIPKDNVAEFLAEAEELDSQEVEVNVTPLTLKDLGDVVITPSVMAKIIFLVEEDEED